MSEKPKSIFDVITDHSLRAWGDSEREASNRIRNLGDELTPLVRAMEKKLDAIMTTVAMQMTVLPDDSEECSICGTCDEHTPDCLVATLKYILAMPAEPTA